MRVRALAVGLLAALGCLPAWAQEPAFGGHLKAQAGVTHYRSDDLASVLGYDPAGDRQLDLRLKTSKRSGAWTFQADYELLVTAGDSLLRVLAQAAVVV
ncbi:MAG: hypothetical protein AAB329_05010, partial [Pseudomonadota bacterium]